MSRSRAHGKNSVLSPLDPRSLDDVDPELSPIQALHDNAECDRRFADSYDALTEHRIKRFKMAKSHYSIAKAPQPDWMKDPSLLPKKPPRSAT